METKKFPPLFRKEIGEISLFQFCLNHNTAADLYRSFSKYPTTVPSTNSLPEKRVHKCQNNTLIDSLITTHQLTYPRSLSKPTTHTQTHISRSQLKHHFTGPTFTEPVLKTTRLSLTLKQTTQKTTYKNIKDPNLKPKTSTKTIKLKRLPIKMSSFLPRFEL